MTDRMSTAANDILKEYQHWRSGPSGNEAAYRYYKVKLIAMSNQRALLELLKNNGVADREASELLLIGGHGGSVNKRHNEAWWGFTALAREHIGELRPCLQAQLNWLLEVHEW